MKITPSDFNHFKEFLAERLKLQPDKREQLSATAPAEIYSLSSTLGLTSGQMSKLMAEFLRLTHLQFLNPQDIHLGNLPARFCRTNLVLAMNRGNAGQGFVVSNPFNWELLDMLNKFTGFGQESRLFITEPANIFGLFREEDPLGRKGSETIFATPRGEKPVGGLGRPTHSEIELLPVSLFAERILEQALTQRASDVHVEPKASGTSVRFRIDGEMREVFTLDKDMGPRIVSCFKSQGGMDIAERRRPQDGSSETIINRRTLKLRMATTLTPDGESLIIRLLEPEAKLKDLGELGMTNKQVRVMNGLANRSQGLILFVGPTGSGKTTTIYSFLSHIDCRTRSIISVEDPVEYRIPFANQQQVNERAGITFESLLRSVMRQDPDILFQGEVRDAESAKIAMDFASTGHLTITTLHTANATTAIFRLERLGITRSIMAEALLGVIAQRLLRKLCTHCKETVPISEEERTWLLPFTREIPSQVAHPVGCSWCNQTGYCGREGVYEIIRFDPEVTRLIRSERPISEIRHFVQERGDELNSHHAVEKVRNLLFSPKDIYEKVLVEEIQFHQEISEEKAPTITSPSGISGRQSSASKLQLVRGGQSTPPDKTAGRPPSILIVEDDKVTRLLTQRILKKSHHKVTVAEDGIDALLHLGREDFDLIVSDVSMPNLDGFKLLEMMNQKGMETPVIFMTGDTSDEGEEKGFELGAADYVKKPVREEILLERVRNALETTSERRAREVRKRNLTILGV